MKYSIIVPVYNRPDEVDELLESLSNQTQQDFEVIIVEDGSVKPCKDVCDKYAGILALHYYAKENSGPGQSRNYGAERANGEWLVILDSDVVLPEGYLAAVDSAISHQTSDIFPQPSTPYVLCVSSIDPRKNFARLIEACQGLTGAKLYIVGKYNRVFSQTSAL